MNNFLSKIDLKNTLLNSWKNQLPKIRLTLLISFAIGLGGIIIVYILSLLMGVPPAWLTRDPADITGSGSYIGMLSNLGIMGWTATTTICFWAAFLLRQDNRSRKSMYFLFAFGFLCLLLTFDDAFLFHERILPRLHIPENGIFFGYLFIMVGYLGYFFRRILKTDYLILILAFFFLGLSVAMDQILPFSDLESFLEDCPKFLGIMLWLAYFSRTAFLMVKDSFAGRVVEG